MWKEALNPGFGVVFGADDLLKNGAANFLTEALERTQQVKGTKVTIGESVRLKVTKTAGALVETVADAFTKDSSRIPQARYKEVVALYRAADQPKEGFERTSIFA